MLTVHNEEDYEICFFLYVWPKIDSNFNLIGPPEKKT